METNSNSREENNNSIESNIIDIDSLLKIAGSSGEGFDGKTIDSAQEWKALKKILATPKKRTQLNDFLSKKENLLQFNKLLGSSYIDKLVKLTPGRSFSKWLTMKQKEYSLSLEEIVALMEELQGLNYSIFQSEFIERNSSQKIVSDFPVADPYFKFTKNWLRIKHFEKKGDNEENGEIIQDKKDNNEKIKLEILGLKAGLYKTLEEDSLKKTTSLGSEIKEIHEKIQKKLIKHFEDYNDEYKELLKHTSGANFLTKWIANNKGYSLSMIAAKIFNVLGSLDYTILTDTISSEILCHQIALMDAYNEAQERHSEILEKRTELLSYRYNLLREGVRSGLLIGEDKKIFDDFILHILLPSGVVTSDLLKKFPGLTEERLRIGKAINSYSYSRSHGSGEKFTADMGDNETYKKYIDSLIALDSGKALTEEVSKMAGFADIIDQIEGGNESERCTPITFSELSIRKINNIKPKITENEQKYMDEGYQWYDVTFPGGGTSTLLFFPGDYMNYSLTGASERYVIEPKGRIVEQLSGYIVREDEKGYILRDMRDMETKQTIPYSTVGLIHKARASLEGMNKSNSAMQNLETKMKSVQNQCLPFIRTLQLVQKGGDTTYKLQNSIVEEASSLKANLTGIRDDLGGVIAYTEDYLEEKLLLGEILSDRDKQLRDTLDGYKSFIEQIKEGGQIEKLLKEVLNKKNMDPDSYIAWMRDQGLPMLGGLIVGVLTMIASGGMSLPVIALSTATGIVGSRVTQYAVSELADYENKASGGLDHYDNPTLEQLLKRGDITQEQYIKTTGTEFLVGFITSACIIGLGKGISQGVGIAAKSPGTMGNIARALQNNRSFMNPFKSRNIDMSKPSALNASGSTFREKMSVASVQSMQEVGEEFAESFPELLMSFADTTEVDWDDEKSKKKAGGIWTKCLGYAIAVSFCLHPTTVRHTFGKKYDLQMSQDKLLQIEGKIVETTFVVNDQDFYDFGRDAERVYSKLGYVMENTGDELIFRSSDKDANPPHTMTFIKNKESLDIASGKEKVPGFKNLGVEFTERRIVDGEMTYLYTYKEDSYQSQEREQFSLQEYLEEKGYYTFDEGGKIIASKPGGPHIELTKNDNEKSKFITA